MTDWIAVCMEQYASEIPMEAWYDLPQKEPIAESVPAWDGLRDGKRNTEKQASLYDAMLAEIYAERNKAKARRVRKPDNRTRAERLADWDAEKDRRKWHRFDRDWELYNRDWKARSDYMSHAERKIRKAEQVARADWEIESVELELDAEFNFWMRKIEDERLASLNDWLKYA